jgi:hypothetical protein
MKLRCPFLKRNRVSVGGVIGAGRKGHGGCRKAMPGFVYALCDMASAMVRDVLVRSFGRL